MGASELLATRITRAIKQRVAGLVQADFLTESIWLRRLVLKELQAAPEDGPRHHNAETIADNRRCCSEHRALGQVFTSACGRKTDCCCTSARRRVGWHRLRTCPCSCDPTCDRWPVAEGRTRRPEARRERVGCHRAQSIENNDDHPRPSCESKQEDWGRLEGGRVVMLDYGYACDSETKVREARAYFERFPSR